MDMFNTLLLVNAAAARLKSMTFDAYASDEEPTTQDITRALLNSDTPGLAAVYSKHPNLLNGYTTHREEWLTATPEATGGMKLNTYIAVKLMDDIHNLS